MGANEHYRSECQVKLDTFIKRYKEDAGSAMNMRSDGVEAQLSESDEEIRQDAGIVLNIGEMTGLGANAPKDATGCT